MLSEKEKHWVWFGSVGIFCLLYVVLVLSPLIVYQRKMEKRIRSEWLKVQRLEKRLEEFGATSRQIQGLIRRVKGERPEAPAKVQLSHVIKRVIGKEGEISPLRFDPAGEWNGMTLMNCFFRVSTTPAKAFQLIDRIDHHYLPMRVTRWKLNKKRKGFVLEVNVLFLEAGQKP